MKIKFIRDALSGKVGWFIPDGNYSEDDLRKGIDHSVEVSKEAPPYAKPIEEFGELIQVLMKLELNPSDEDEILHLHEEISDALWGIAYLIRRYNLSIPIIKNIRKLKDAYEYEK